MLQQTALLFLADQMKGQMRAAELVCAPMMMLMSVLAAAQKPCRCLVPADLLMELLTRRPQLLAHCLAVLMVVLTAV